MEPAPQRTRITLDERTIRIAVGALGAFHILLGLYQLLAPGSFFARIGTYGIENTHYVGDVGAFVLAFGIALVLAVGRPSWRAPLLYLGAIWYALHAVNHLFDIDEARSTARGAIDTIVIAFVAGLLAWLANAADRLGRPPDAAEAVTAVRRERERRRG
jgi:hypothetical protein